MERMENITMEKKYGARINVMMIDGVENDFSAAYSSSNEGEAAYEVLKVTLKFGCYSAWTGCIDDPLSQLSQPEVYVFEIRLRNVT